MMSEDGYILGQNTFRKAEQKPPRQLRRGGSASRRRAVISGSCHEADNDHSRCSCCRCQTVRSGSAHAVRIGWPWPYCAHTRTPEFHRATPDCHTRTPQQPPANRLTSRSPSAPNPLQSLPERKRLPVGGETRKPNECREPPSKARHHLLKRFSPSLSRLCRN